MLRATLLLLVMVPLAAAPVPKDATPMTRGPNTNSLLRDNAGKFKAEASTEYNSVWGVNNLFDNNMDTPWYSAEGDAPMSGKEPWVRVTFNHAVNIRRVTVLGNRDPEYPTGYKVLAGTFELLDSDSNVILKKDIAATGEKFDFDWIIGFRENVRAIRFTATKDDKSFRCVGLAEMLAE